MFSDKSQSDRNKRNNVLFATVVYAENEIQKIIRCFWEFQSVSSPVSVRESFGEYRQVASVSVIVWVEL